MFKDLAMTEYLIIGGSGVILLGIIVVIVSGKKKSKTKDRENTVNNQDVLNHALYQFENKVKQSLNLIDEKTQISLEQIDERLEQRIQDLNPPISQSPDTTKKSKLATKHSQIYNLYNQGKSVKDIAIELNKGVGEIETIVSLLTLERDNQNG